MNLRDFQAAVVKWGEVMSGKPAAERQK